MRVDSLTKFLAYGALNTVTFGRGVPRRIGGEIIRFPARWCRYYPSDYEPTTFEFLRVHCQQGDTVLDIGAHLGLFSVLMARRVGPSGRVFSFEPSDTTRSVLFETVLLNCCADLVEVRSEAIAKDSGRLTFYETGDVVSNANSLVSTERSKRSATVNAVSIDDLVRSRNLDVRCMKIDVEGAELGALRGARGTLLACRPAVHLSLHPKQLLQAGGSLPEVWDVAREVGMRITQCGRLVDAGWFSEQNDLFDVDLVPADVGNNVTI